MMKNFLIVLCGLILLLSNNSKAQYSELDYLKYALGDSVVQSHISMHLERRDAIDLNVHYHDTFIVTINSEEKSDSAQNDYANVMVNSITSSKSGENKQIEINLSLNEVSAIYIKLAYRNKQLYVRKVKGNTKLGKKRKSSIFISNY